jgi:NADH:ubiquinone oxidoreductase subunit 4 (subunit M)
MNNAQRLSVIIALVVIGFVLAWLMLDWQNGYGGGTRILIFYEEKHPVYPNLTAYYGIYAVDGVSYVAAVLLGMVLPLCLFAVAAFLAFGRRKA